VDGHDNFVEHYIIVAYSEQKALNIDGISGTGIAI
jgi:hypothetical protein